MSVFKKYLAIFIPTVLISVLLLRWYAMQFLYRTPEKFWAGISTTLEATGLIALIVLIVVFKMTRPFTKLINKIKQGYEPTNDERAMALGIYNKLNKVTITANVVGFFVGQVAVLIIEIIMGVTEYKLSRALITVVQSILIGAMSASFSIFTLNEALASDRQLLKIQSIDLFNKLKTQPISVTIGLITGISLLYVWMSTMCVPYGIINVQDTNPVSNALSSYIGGSILACIASFIPAFALILIVLRGLRIRIKNTASQMDEIAKDGNLSSRINITMLDDFGSLNSSINSFINQLSGMITKIREETGVVSNSAQVLSTAVDTAAESLFGMNAAIKQISAEGSNQNNLIKTASSDIEGLTKGAQEVEQQVLAQSSAIQESSASVSEMAANISSVAGMTKKADEVSVHLSTASVRGNDAVSKAVAAVAAIQGSSLEVQQIVQAIQKIASQTNLLSMNAAIEAAHAGEAGKGFAIVANEVRSLAASSAKSAKDIQVRIKDMVAKVTDGVDAIQEAGSAFREITGKVEENSSLIQTISQAMEEQRIGASETMTATAGVVDAITAIKELTENQSNFAKRVQEAMDAVVVSSKEVDRTINTTTESSQHLRDSIEQVEAMAGKNSEAVSEMMQSIEVFKV